MINKYILTIFFLTIICLGNSVFGGAKENIAEFLKGAGKWWLAPAVVGVVGAKGYSKGKEKLRFKIAERIKNRALEKAKDMPELLKLLDQNPRGKSDVDEDLKRVNLTQRIYFISTGSYKQNIYAAVTLINKLKDKNNNKGDIYIIDNSVFKRTRAEQFLYSNNDFFNVFKREVIDKTTEPQYILIEDPEIFSNLKEFTDNVCSTSSANVYWVFTILNQDVLEGIKDVATCIKIIRIGSLYSR